MIGEFMQHDSVFLCIKQTRMLCVLLNAVGFALLMVHNCYNVGVKKIAVALMGIATASLFALLSFVKLYIPELGANYVGMLKSDDTEEACVVNGAIFKKFTIADRAFVVITSLLLSCCAAEKFVSSDNALKTLLVIEAAICGIALSVWTGYIALRTTYWAIGTCCMCAFQDSLSGKKEPDLLDNIAISLLENRGRVIL
ncbi:MAG: hypothetical protein AB8U44_04105 [Aaplasma endosymbiont of Hyalomma asiaticum]